MSAIDPSTIDTTQPPAIAPTTSGVRGVFLAIKALFTTTKSELETLETEVETAQDLAETHASRHLPSGADPLTTAAPDTVSTTGGANAEGSAESYARSDHVHAVALTKGTVAGRPAAAAAGLVYFASNAEGGQIQRDTGAAWEAMAPGVDHTHLRAAITDGKVLVAGDKLSEERLLAGYSATVEVAAVVVGGDYYDHAEHVIGDLTTTLRFRVVLSSSDAGKTAHAILYNLSDAATVADLSTSNTTPTELTADIVPGTTANFPAAKKMYEIRLYVAGGTGAESAILHKASIDVMHAV